MEVNLLSTPCSTLVTGESAGVTLITVGKLIFVAWAGFRSDGPTFPLLNHSSSNYWITSILNLLNLLVSTKKYLQIFFVWFLFSFLHVVGIFFFLRLCCHSKDR